MKSVQLVEPRKLEVIEIPMPHDPGPGAVLVRNRAVGICGSDMHWYLDGRIGANSVQPRQILGHEPTGEIVAVGPPLENGSGVENLKPGQRVVLEPAITCGHCDQCLRGRHNLCRTVKFMGAQLPGFFREFALLPAHNAIPIPDRMTFDQAVLLEPLAVMIHIRELVDICLGDRVVVMGAGPVGILAANMARLSGAGHIVIADKVPHRLRMAKAAGVDTAVNVCIERLLDVVMDVTGGLGADVVIDAAAYSETIDLGMAITRPGGTLVLLGICTEYKPRLDIHIATNNEIRIQPIRRSNQTIRPAMDFMLAGRVWESVITHHLPLERTSEGFDLLTEYSDDVGKVIVEM